MGAERVVAAGQVFTGVAVEVAESGREAVAAMLERRSAQRPPGILEPLGQSHEPLATRMT